ncbi:MAG: hypothetical protein KAH03_08565 [Cocleimonas sp.]|nr:hypothetical protein [Cocleimonas sp.]
MFVSESLTPLPQPTLIRESKNYSSVVLQWKDRVVDNVTLHIHKKVLETDSDWQLHNVFKYYPTPGTIHVKQLHPYVTYEVSWIFANRFAGVHVRGWWVWRQATVYSK